MTWHPSPLLDFALIADEGERSAPNSPSVSSRRGGSVPGVEPAVSVRRVRGTDRDGLLEHVIRAAKPKTTNASASHR